METNAPRKVLRQRIFSSAALLVALTSSHACMKSDCADTESCGSFTPAAGCGWRLDDDTVVYSTDDLEALDATWSESSGWTLPNGHHPVFSCDLPANPDDDAGMTGNGGSSGEGSGNSGASNAGNQGNSGANTGGNGGNNGGNGGSGGVETDGGGNTLVCSDALESGCTPAQQNGVFVDASAPDGGNGSLAAPLNSIVDALSVAQGSNATDIYICAGNYDERVVITDSEAGIDLHGGFNCNGFTYDASVPVISRSNGGYALYIDALNSPITIEDLAFTAVDATSPGESSIAAFISASTSITFNRCQFTAGAGVDGDDGVTEDFVEGATAGVNWPVLATLGGNDGGSSAGGIVKGPIMCPAGDTNFGGSGGSQLPEDGTGGGPASTGGSAGQAEMACNGDGAGGNGTPGASGEDGSSGSIGTLDAAGFSPSSGSDGTAGETGGGGGGGAGSDASGGNGGGGGGAGGCGGNFGPGGQGGGASIALLVYNSIVIVRESALVSADAGDGGNGDVGQDGQHIDGEPTLASNGGTGPNFACDGGTGAAGGNGGGGGGGAGGISVGVLSIGTTAPVLDQATTDAITVGTEGAAGAGGGVDNDGAAGIAQSVYEL